MKIQPNLGKAFRLRWVMLLAALLSASAGAASPGPTLADGPIFSTVIVPANVAFDLSVEFPTAVGDAYFSTTTYSTGTEFVGYFNPNFCYDYVTNGGSTAHTAKFETLVGFFKPFGPATSHGCSGHWSGNFLNWILTQTVDPLRKTMTGGARIVDESGGATILQKAFEDDQGSSGSNMKQKTLGSSALVSGATPFTWSSMHIMGLHGGLNFAFSNGVNMPVIFRRAPLLTAERCALQSRPIRQQEQERRCRQRRGQQQFQHRHGERYVEHADGFGLRRHDHDYDQIRDWIQYQTDLTISGCPTGVTCVLSASSVSSSNTS